MTGVCKFCGCTENAPCIIQGNFASQLDGYPSPQSFACAWLLDDVCTNPACIEKAYLEAKRLVDEMIARDLHAILEVA